MQRKYPSLIVVLSTLMRNLLMTVSLVAITGHAQALEVQPQVITKSVIDGKVIVLELGLHFATTIRLPEPVSSVVVGDPTLFRVEHSEKEPRLVFVKPLTQEPAESNLLISTVGDHNLSLLVRSNPEGSKKPSSSQRPVHFVMNYRSASGFLIEDTGQSSVLIPETVPVSQAGSREAPARATPLDAVRNRLDGLLDEQKSAALPSLEGHYLRVGISRVYEEGTQIYVLFSVVNQGKSNLEILPPQVQLAGSDHSKKLSGSSEQSPVTGFVLSRRKLGTGERADGVVRFEKPSFKQSRESYFLQVAESGAVDLPVLVPIRLGMSIPLKGEER
jgi:hypothetical protein